MTTPEKAAAALPNAASTTQPTSQAERTARRAAFRAAFAKPAESRSTAEHDAAIEAFVAQLQPLRRVPRRFA